MIHAPIYITRADLELIRDRLREAENSGYRGSPYIQKLKAELARAEVVASDAALQDVITLDTTALLVDTDTQEPMQLTLVLPEHADLSQGKISFLAPIGAAMLGYRTGSTFEWETPGGVRSLRVEKIISKNNAPAQ
jgi:regulator of nucleoside diphosphate kinase